MADLLEVVRTRRSIRNFEEREVPEEVLEEVLEAARWAPSWANTQCWEIIVLKDKETRDRLLDSFNYPNPAKKAMTRAPVVLALCGKLKSSGYYKGETSTKFGDWFMFDLGIVTQTICLAAQNRGLGTVIVGLFDHNKAQDLLGVKEGYELVVFIPMGYPEKVSSAPGRRTTDEFVHHERF
ncbi:MAG: nitroreductase family protein [Deltaproteobacteria bacterium]|nr:nitroreductase family protein [Deltaproteobacteria bacterium]MBW2136991.1 nitroreductase family protein [Deltaproteobacteria bacterium]